MKVVIIGASASIDNELCLIKGLQNKGLEFRYYFLSNSLNLPILTLKKAYPSGIIPASTITEMKVFADYVNLDNIFMISAYKLRFRSPKLFYIYLKLVLSLLKYNPDVLHFTWPQIRTSTLPYILKYVISCKMVLTVHDPIPHSSHVDDKTGEYYRNKAFHLADRLVLLNDKMTDEFVHKYKIDRGKICYSRLGVQDYLDTYPAKAKTFEKKYILFIGQILSYKGLDYLLPAMEKVHKVHPEWMLVIAGSGKFYFDISKYQKEDYVVFYNHFIEMSEMVSLIKGCEFAVAPYKDATQSGVLLNIYSLNKPMIVTRVGVLPDVVKNGETGIVIPASDTDSLADAMLRLIENPNILNEMSKNIRNNWRKNMEWGLITEGLLDVYKSVS